MLLFWGAYDTDRDLWRIESRSRSGDTWSAIETSVPPEGNDAIQRRHPVAVADDTGGVWLLWLEQVGSEWVLKYNRHDGAQLAGQPLTDLPG